MKLWGYYAWHTFINTIKKIFKSKVVAIIICCMVIGGIVGGTVAVVGSFVEKSVTSDSELGELFEDEDEDMDDEEEEDDFSEDDIRMIKKCIDGGAMALIIFLVLLGLYAGSKNGGDIFLMADVNFLFAAPMKPQSILLFRLSFQMVAMMFASIYFLFQIPNLLNAGLSGYSIFALIVAWVMVLFISRIVNVFSYTITTTYTRLKQYILPVVLIIAVALAGGVGSVFIATGKDIEATLDRTLCAPGTDYIPLFGWFKAMIMCAIEEDISGSMIYAALNLVLIAIFMVLIWKIKADFYEDAIAGAAKRDEIAKNAAEGRNAKKDSKEASKRSDRLEKKGTSFDAIKGEGASTFFHKNYMNRKRFSRFGFITNTMITYFAICALATAFFYKATDYREIDALGAIMMLVLFFRSFGNPIGVETSHNWLFLVPDNPYKKVFYALLSGTVDTALDLLPGFVISGIVLQASPIGMIVWYITLITLDFMYSCFGIMLEAILPVNGMDTVKAMFQVMLRFVILIFVLLAFSLGLFLSGILMGAVCTMIMSIVVGGICFIAYPSMLHEGIG